MLAHKANVLGVSEDMSIEDIEKVLSLYNGTGDWAVKYGQVTIQYYKAFKNYNDCEME